MNIWKIAPGEQAKLWRDCKDNGYICIGWEELGDIKQYKNHEAIKKELGLGQTGAEQRNNAKSLWDFVYEIKIGDLIFSNMGTQKIKGVGVVIGDYLPPNSKNNPRKKEYTNVRKVHWIQGLEGEIEGKFDLKTVTKLKNNDERVLDILTKNGFTLDKLIKLRNEIMLSVQMEEKIKLLEDRKQIILQGPPGTGKTRSAKQMAIQMIDGSKPYGTNKEIKASLQEIGSEQVKLIQFHPSYSYEDFVRGIVADSSNGTITYKTEDKILAQMAKAASNNIDESYILIIDEINRANLSSVLGELIYALEYRGEAVESMYEVGGSREITLPSNLYIIGTMNTADRSIGHIDYAIRRRFTFVDVLADEDVADENSSFGAVKALFKNENNERADTLSPEFDPDDVMPGHSYFIGNEEILKNKLEYQVKPLLREYIKDGILNENARDAIEKLSVQSNDK